jgi:hypothetical protein
MYDSMANESQEKSDGMEVLNEKGSNAGLKEVNGE